MHIVLATIFAAWCLLNPPAAEAGELTLSFGQDKKVLTTSQLLSRPDVADLTVTGDVAYLRDMTYKAVPLLNLLVPESSPVHVPTYLVALLGKYLV